MNSFNAANINRNVHTIGLGDGGYAKLAGFYFKSALAVYREIWTKNFTTIIWLDSCPRLKTPPLYAYQTGVVALTLAPQSRIPKYSYGLRTVEKVTFGLLFRLSNGTISTSPNFLAFAWAYAGRSTTE
jgi:hypothetical protein